MLLQAKVEKLRLDVDGDRGRSLAAREELLADREQQLTSREHQLRLAESALEQDRHDARNLMKGLQEQANKTAAESSLEGHQLTNQLKLLGSQLEACGTLQSKETERFQEVQRKRETELSAATARCDAQSEAVDKRETALRKEQMLWANQFASEQKDAEQLRVQVSSSSSLCGCDGVEGRRWKTN